MPETPDRHDLVVIGAGPAGLVAAEFGAQFGADVLLIERDRVGGDCTWTGCLPSKALLHAAAVAHQVRNAADFGIGTGQLEIDFAKLMGQVRAAVARVYSFETPEQLRERGIQVLHGAARFIDAGTVEVDGRRVEGRRFVISTGARSQLPPVAGLDTVPHLTYERFFALDRLPQHLLVLGGGPVGVELSQALLRLGSRVTLLEKEERLLPAADAEAAEVLTQKLRAEGMQIELEAEVKAVRTEGREIQAETAAAAFAGDVLLVATGRAPDLDGLDLDRAGVAFDRGGVKVDQHLRTSRSHIYAAGDVTGSHQFTHFAGWQGYIAARNALFPGSQRGTAETVPWAVFTDPEIAQVGLTEDDARARRLEFEVHRLPLERVDRAQTLGDTEGFIKLLSTGAGRILGASIVAPDAAEVANELWLAVGADLSLQQLAKAIHVYPTIGIGVQQLASRFAMRHAASGLRGALARALLAGLRR